MEQSSIRHRRQQSVPQSGVREALLAPTAAPALPDAARSAKSVIAELLSGNSIDIPQLLPIIWIS
jgi:hypothetical protein